MISNDFEKGAPMTSLLTTPRLLFRLEAAALFAVGLLLYGKIGGNWLVFAVLLLLPDVSMVGYMGGDRVGAAIYNLVHLYLWPSILAAFGILVTSEATLALALIWFSHISMDRTLGYGLKLPTGFKHTHVDMDDGHAPVFGDGQTLVGASLPVSPS
jgi:hypothetical protein